MTRQSLLYPPETQSRLLQGVEQFADLLAATLGPRQGIVLSQQGNGKPEILDESGVIARRVTALPDAGANVGAMLMRQLAEQMHERYRDGAALAGVLCRAMLREAVQMIAAGHNPMLLRQGMMRGTAAAVEHLAAQSQPVQGQKMLKQLVMTAIRDVELSDMLSEMFDLLGEHGAYIVEEYAAPYIDRAYIDGGRWRARPAARAFMPPGNAELTLTNPLVLVVDEKIEQLASLRPALEGVARIPGKPPLLIVAREISGDALQALTLNVTQGKLSLGAAVSIVGESQITLDLEDLALLTGATLMKTLTGHPLARVQPTDLGRCRSVTLSKDSLTIIGGQGDPGAMQERVTALRAQLNRIPTPNDDWERLRLRIARLSGGLGILKIGAYSLPEREQKKDLAQKAMRVLELALRDGVLPGGGVAFLNCIPSVKQARNGLDDDTAAYGVDIMARALSAPFQQIVANAGTLHPPIAQQQAQATGQRFGYDVLTDGCVDMVEAGILDARTILQGALESATSTAVMALTTDVVVLRAK